MAGTLVSKVSIAALFVGLVAGGAACASAPSNGAAGVATASAAPVASDATPAPTTADPAPTVTAARTVAPTAPTVATSPTPTASTPAPSSTASAAPRLFKAQALFDEPSFEGGDVPKAKETLEKFTKAVEKCVDDAGGVGPKGATIKIQFLVRMKGIAEGIDVLGATGLEEKPGKCVRDVFKKKPIGTPSSDPVGVTFTITFAPSGEPRSSK